MYPSLVAVTVYVPTGTLLNVHPPAEPDVPVNVEVLSVVSVNVTLALWIAASLVLSLTDTAISTVSSTGSSSPLGVSSPEGFMLPLLYQFQ